MKKKKVKIKKGAAIVISKEHDALFLACEQVADTRNAINYFAAKLRLGDMRLHHELVKAYPGIDKHFITSDNIEEGKHIVRIGEIVKPKGE